MAGHEELRDEDLVDVDLGLDPNEASGLAAVADADLLARLGWDDGYWTVLDHGPVRGSGPTWRATSGARRDLGARGRQRRGPHAPAGIRDLS